MMMTGDYRGKRQPVPGVSDNNRVRRQPVPGVSDIWIAHSPAIKPPALYHTQSQNKKCSGRWRVTCQQVVLNLVEPLKN
jgi:hypothetical protein